ncbi:hypothetical protein BaRGS_00022833 [Batillaria attramentaria]|uniref:Uncharacterized protein n=1 Tax=Batillaria attramentaria TaxID=370345 RepID=A0ABD0KFT8_9CAEN
MVHELGWMMTPCTPPSVPCCIRHWLRNRGWTVEMAFPPLESIFANAKVPDRADGTKPTRKCHRVKPAVVLSAVPRAAPNCQRKQQRMAEAREKNLISFLLNKLTLRTLPIPNESLDELAQGKYLPARAAGTARGKPQHGARPRGSLGKQKSPDQRELRDNRRFTNIHAHTIAGARWLQRENPAPSIGRFDPRRRCRLLWGPRPAGLCFSGKGL